MLGVVKNRRVSCLLAALLGGTAVGFALPASAATLLYTSRTTFNAAVGTQIIDDYSNPGYNFVNSDAYMSSVIGQTDYVSTGHTNTNIVASNDTYCAGCNGSFRLSFLNTDVSTVAGVYGVGWNLGFTTYTAFVTFGDGSTQDYALYPYSNSGFFGITSDLGVRSIHVAYSDARTTGGAIQIDNLTVAAATTTGGAGVVPEPTTWALMILGFGSAGAMLRRRRTAFLA
jgi:hypothetical protein